MKRAWSAEQLAAVAAQLAIADAIATHDDNTEARRNDVEWRQHLKSPEGLAYSAAKLLDACVAVADERAKEAAAEAVTP